MKGELKRHHKASCCCTKGFGMDSMVSAGHTSTTAVPLHTTKPRLRDSSVSLNGSSWSIRLVREWIKWQNLKDCTLDVLYSPIQYDIQKLIETLQYPGCCVIFGVQVELNEPQIRFLPSLPPWNLTLTLLSKYLPSSALSNVSFFFLSAAFCVRPESTKAIGLHWELGKASLPMPLIRSHLILNLY